MEPDDNIEIEMIRDNVHQCYIGIGSYSGHHEGILLNWPRGDHPGVADWQKTLLASDLINKLLLVGSFLREDVNELLKPEMIVFVEMNKSNIGAIINKYIDDFEGVLCVNERFLDLVFGPYGTDYLPVKVLENVDADPNKKYFADGTLLHILNKEASWEDMYGNTFIEAELYDEFLRDITLIEEVFKMYIK
ncbi:MAG: hypothetical protein IPL09_07530 [Bacteroidetes bacterium]|nr:hypothetical protein [Bacteroidota bacterium]